MIKVFTRTIFDHHRITRVEAIKNKKKKEKKIDVNIWKRLLLWQQQMQYSFKKCIIYVLYKLLFNIM